MAPLLILAAWLAGCRAPAASLVEAQLAYRQSRVAEAEGLFARIADDAGASSALRGEALRENARIAWLVDADASRALRLLDRAAGFAGACQTAVLRARILDESKQAAALVRQLDGLLAGCRGRGTVDDIRAAAADAALTAAGEQNGEGRWLARAAAALQRLSEDGRATSRGSALRLELALMRSDAGSALQAWRDFFWLPDRDSPPALAALEPSATVRFGRALGAAASVEDRLRLIDLLVRAGFARPAERFAARHHLAESAGGNPLWRKASAYFAERHRLEDLILASNRRVARGGAAANLRAALMSFEAALAAAASLTGERRQALLAAYGLYGSAGTTEGFASVHLGHVVQRERLAVDQYGHRADVDYLAIDNMISNGYLSWLWDGDAASGGWAEDGPTIVQVRPEYTSAVLNGWRIAHDRAQRADLLARLPEREAADRAALRSAAVAYLPGLQTRLRLQFVDQVAARARAVAGARGDLRRAFLGEYWRAVVQQSMAIHEGRHALDDGLLPRGCRRDLALLEYRAKLSELALADYPRLALFNIDDSEIGASTQHGRANARVMAAYAAWAGSHRAQIAGYDGRLPALLQLDRLTDGQIRAAARSLDPLARPGAAARRCT